MDQNAQKQHLRKQLREKRRALDEHQRKIASQALLQLASSHHLFGAHQHIAFYVSHDGEIDPELLLNYAWKHNKTCYLPVVPKQSNHMHFVHITDLKSLYHNHYGILEPAFDPALEIQPEKLDVVLLPLVAFDTLGHRLGRGKGYYDRCFSFLHSKSERPFLVGLAYEFQRVHELPKQSHDVPLHAVLTEKNYYAY